VGDNKMIKYNLMIDGRNASMQPSPNGQYCKVEDHQEITILTEHEMNVIIEVLKEKKAKDTMPEIKEKAIESVIGKLYDELDRKFGQ
jgi:hypothetical protein